MDTDRHRLTVLNCTHNRAELLLCTLHYLNAALRPQGWQVQILVALVYCCLVWITPDTIHIERRGEK
jgi:hypothetical protein